MGEYMPSRFRSCNALATLGKAANAIAASRVPPRNHIMPATSGYPAVNIVGHACYLRGNLSAAWARVYDRTPVGGPLCEWRQHQSQLALACNAGISTRAMIPKPSCSIS